jgi:hypothetical protein
MNKCSVVEYLELKFYGLFVYTYCLQNTFECIWQQLNVRRAINVTHIDKRHNMYGIYNVIFYVTNCSVAVFYHIQQVFKHRHSFLKTLNNVVPYRLAN